MMYGYGYYDYPFHMFSSILVGIFWIILIIALIRFLRSTGRYGHRTGSWRDTGMFTRDTPIDILKERYARGEITKEQFEQMKRDLA